MASGFVQTNGRVIAGEGDPADGDALVLNLSLFPINSLYVNNNTGKLWVRNEENLVAADWVGASGGGGGDSLFPDTGTGTATGAVVGDLDGNTLRVDQDGNPLLLIDPTVNAESVLLQAFNITAGNNFAVVENQTSDVLAQAQLRANFNNTEEAKITVFADTNGSSITHTADTHTFNVEGQNNLVVSLGSSDLRSFDPTDENNSGRFTTSSTNVEAQILLEANFNDGVKLAKIQALANATQSTITHTADQHIFNGLQNFATNAAAVSGGVPVGGLYYTDTAGQAVVKIVI